MFKSLLLLISTLGFILNSLIVSEKPAEKQITLIMTGDVNLGRSVNYQIWKTKNPSFPFEKIAPILKSADITIINLESPLIKNCPLTNSGMKFCSEASNVFGLTWLGVDVVVIANNHAQDFGQAGVEETERILEANGIQVVEHGETLIEEVEGVKLAILAYDLVGHSFAPEKLEKEIEEAKKLAPLVVAVFHWGVEYTHQPSLFQKQVADLAIEAGADLVLGNHPHWVQPQEIYRGKLIVYSHGNFVFDQPWSEETKEGIVGEYHFSQTGLIEANYLPIVINDWFQPEQAQGLKARKIIGIMR